MTFTPRTLIERILQAVEVQPETPPTFDPASGVHPVFARLAHSDCTVKEKDTQ